MSLELQFSKVDSAPWGFRLTGGRDFDIPLTVVKIIEGSLAEKFGLTEGDTVVRINDQSTAQMTHDEAHDVITKAGINFVMAVERAQQYLDEDTYAHNGQTDPELDQGLPPINQDICPIIAEVPYSQNANEPNDRSLTSSPYFHPTKSYKPFSEKPIIGVPPIEEPIILSAAYTDDFSSIVKPDFEPDTIFKLERVNHSNRQKLYLEDTKNLTIDINNLEEEIDLKAIEISAKEIVDVNIDKAVRVTEEIKREIEMELHKSIIVTNEKELDISFSEKRISLDNIETECINQGELSPTEKQMWLMTAEYDSKSAILELSETLNEESCLKIEETCLNTNIQTTERSSEINTSNSESFTETCNNKNIIKCDIINEIKSDDTIQHTDVSNIIAESKIETSIYQETDVLNKQYESTTNNMSISKSITELTDDITISSLNVDKTELDLSTCHASESLNSVQSIGQQLTEINSETHTQEETVASQNSSLENVENINEAIKNKSHSESVNDDSICLKNEKNITNKSISELKSDLRQSEYYLQEVKEQTLLSANTITEQTKTNIIQRQNIPSVASLPAQTYTDQLLKTFFVHLTDVMIALSRMIIAEGGVKYGSRSASPMPPLKRETQTSELLEQVVKKTQISQAQQTDDSSNLISSVSKDNKSKELQEGFSRIVGSKEEVEQLVESVEQTRKLAETVQQARKISMTTEQSEMLAKSAEQLRKLSVTAGQTFVQSCVQSSDGSLEKLSDDLTQVVQLANVTKSDLSMAQECSLRRESNAIDKIIGQRDPLEWLSEKDQEFHSLEKSSNEFHSELIESNELIQKNEELHLNILSQSETLDAKCEIKQDTSSSETKYDEKTDNTDSSEYMEAAIIQENEEVKKETTEPLNITNDKTLSRTESEESAIEIVPPTPLTDEYVFKLDIHVKGLRSRTSSPERTKPSEEIPIEHAPLKPRLSASITTEIQSSLDATNAQAETNKEASLDRDDQHIPNEKEIEISDADAKSPQLPGELVTARKTSDTEKSTLEAINQDERNSVQNYTEDAQNVEFKTVEVVVGPEHQAQNGCVNSYNNDNVMEVPEGKPGLTEDEIAVIMSGEAEVLKDSHVLGLQRVLASHMNRLKDEEDDDPLSVNFKKIMPQCSFIKDSAVFKALNEEAVKTKEEKKKEERKFTTFLQRPNRPVPHGQLPGGQFYVPQSAEKYQVKIIKQAKPKVAPDYPRSFETGLLPWEERLLNQPPQPPVEQEPPILVPEDGPEYLEALDNLPESAVPDLEDTGIPLQGKQEEIEHQFISSEEAVAEQEELEDFNGADTESYLDQTTESNLDLLDSMVAEMADPNLSVEEQLAQVQAQLLALAQLPAAIQQTLELVTRQLGNIVPQATKRKQEETSVTEITEELNTDLDLSTTDDKRLEEPVQGTVNGESVEIIQESPLEVQPLQPQVDPEELERARLEEETRIMEQRRIEKQKKDVILQLQEEHNQRQVKQRPTSRVLAKPAFGPLAPQERPIFLPGGRKWKTPKDAFNDAFIAETLTKQAEIIQGKTLGFESDKLPYDPSIWPWGDKQYFRIYKDSNCHLVKKRTNDNKRVNFLKYEKPPVSLDHLKQSLVYKMVHDMDDAPLRGIETKTNIPIAEEDFREKCSSVTPSSALQIYEDHTVLPQQVQP